MILAGDVGATKILLEAGEFRSGRWQPALARRYLVCDFDNFSDVIGAFLEEWKSAAPPSDGRLASAAVGVAGPVQGNRVKMTHRPWVIDGDALATRNGIPRVRVLNDLAAAAHGIDALGPGDVVTVQEGKEDPNAPRVVLGVGTGLGVAYLVPRGDRTEVIPGEGGHVGFSPSGARQAELWRALAARNGRVEAEEVASGIGLANIYEVLRLRGECPAGSPERAEPAWIAEQAAAGQPSCVLALELFAECLGNVAGDHALATMARGGVYLAGGVIARIAPRFNATRFCAEFCAKGLFSDALMHVPVRLVTNERLPVIGAARAASF